MRGEKIIFIIALGDNHLLQFDGEKHSFLKKAPFAISNNSYETKKEAEEASHDFFEPYTEKELQEEVIEEFGKPIIEEVILTIEVRPNF